MTEDFSDTNSMFSTLHNRFDNKSKTEDKLNQTEEIKQPKLAQEIEKRVIDVEYDSDDVFANNPSSLMLAKVRVFRDK